MSLIPVASGAWGSSTCGGWSSCSAALPSWRCSAWRAACWERGSSCAGWPSTPRRRHRGVPRARARRRAGVLAAPGRRGIGRAAGRVGVGWLCRREGGRDDSHTALVLVGALAAGIDPGQRRLPLGRPRRDACCSAACCWSTAATSRSRPSRPRLVLAGSALCGARWLAAGLRPAAARAPGAADRRCPTPLLLALVALAARGRALGDRRAAGHGAARRARCHDAPGLPPARALAAGDRRARGGRGRRRAVAVGRARTHRRARRSRCSPAPSSRSSPPAACSSGHARAAARGPPRRRCIASVVLAGCGGSGSGGARRPARGRRHHDAARRHRARRRRRRGARHADPAAEHRSARLRAAPEGRARPPPTPTFVFAERRSASTPGWPTSSSDAGGSPAA